MSAKLAFIVSITAASLLHSSQAQFQHFFGPPAVGFGVGLVSVHRNFPVATSIVSRRSSRQYSQQSFVKSSPFGTSGKIEIVSLAF